MPALAGVCRAGSSYHALQALAQPAAIQIRRLSAKPANGKRVAQSGSKAFRAVQRDEQGAIIHKKKEKNLGAFRPLPVTQLSNSLFESDKRVALRLPKFHPKAVTANMIGQATEFALKDNDPVRMFGLPKKMLLEFRILSTPCSIIRDVTVSTAEMLDEAKEKSSMDTRVVITGRAGCGKSFLLLQAVEYCTANNWIVIYMPRAVKLVNSTTPYQYDLRTQTYLQPAFAFQTLQRMLSVNSVTLAALHTQKKLLFEKREVPVGSSLTELISVAVKDPLSAPAVLEALMTELSQQTKYPVLLAVDDFQSLYCRTAYRDPHFAAIRPYHLSMPRLILDFASGKRSFARGAVLGAINYSDANYPLPLELRRALRLSRDHPTSPYDKQSRTMMEYTKGLRALPVPEQLSLTEAASLFEVWMKDKALVPVAPSVYDELFMSKYTESSGNAREFVWKGLLSSLQS